MHRLFSCLFFPFVLATLTGCQSPGLSQQQTELLQYEGFTLTDDGWELNMSAKLLFPLNSDQLSAEMNTRITHITQQLLSIGIDHARLEGHADSTGTPAYNEELSTRRANSVAQAMINAGMSEEKISVRGMGITKPVHDNSTAQGRRENRRVVIIIDPSN
ncbi:OmpA family protein [Ectopseudomonas mendocina]|uniref:OmpA family protein n=1 Tax=Ectopseudomonas mendocina TaxID=300 RepID=A0ABZ2RHD3_ECTME